MHVCNTTKLIITVVFEPSVTKTKQYEKLAQKLSVKFPNQQYNNVHTVDQ